MADQVLETLDASNEALSPKRRGRPAGQYPSKVFAFRLTGEQATKLDRLAEDMSMTTYAYCQRVMERHLSSRPHRKHGHL